MALQNVDQLLTYRALIVFGGFGDARARGIRCPATRTSASIRDLPLSDGCEAVAMVATRPAYATLVSARDDARPTGESSRAPTTLTVSSSATCTATSKLGTNDVENGMTRYAY